MAHENCEFCLGDLTFLQSPLPCEQMGNKKYELLRSLQTLSQSTVTSSMCSREEAGHVV
jgi:hypothetical protein